MAAIGKWKAGTNAAGSPLSVLSTELNTLGIATMSAASPAIDNDTELDLYADIELSLASLNPTLVGRVDLYILCSIDGTNYPVATAAALRNQQTQLLCSISLDDASAAQRVVIRNILLPPCKFKICLDNQLDVAFASSGNTLKLIRSNLNLNG